MSTLNIQVGFRQGEVTYADAAGTAVTQFDIAAANTQAVVSFEDVPAGFKLWLKPDNGVIDGGIGGLSTGEPQTLPFVTPHVAGNVAFFAVAGAAPNWEGRSRDIIPCMVIGDE